MSKEFSIKQVKNGFLVHRECPGVMYLGGVLETIEEVTTALLRFFTASEEDAITLECDNCDAEFVGFTVWDSVIKDAASAGWSFNLTNERMGAELQSAICPECWAKKEDGCTDKGADTAMDIGKTYDARPEIEVLADRIEGLHECLKAARWQQSERLVKLEADLEARIASVNERFAAQSEAIRRVRFKLAHPEPEEIIDAVPALIDVIEWISPDKKPPHRNIALLAVWENADGWQWVAKSTYTETGRWLHIHKERPPGDHVILWAPYPQPPKRG